jgi:hypothetical protein
LQAESWPRLYSVAIIAMATARAIRPRPVPERPDLIGLIKRRRWGTHPVLVRKAKSIDDHRLDLLWSIIVIELKLQ